jgi:hypothetical protein
MAHNLRFGEILGPYSGMWTGNPCTIIPAFLAVAGNTLIRQANRLCLETAQVSV